MPRLPEDFRRAIDTSGDPAPGAMLYVYRAGTTEAVTTFSDSGLSIANAWPIVADASGAFGDVYLYGGFFKVKTTDASGVDLPGSPVDDIEVADDVLSVASLAMGALTAIYPTREVVVRGGVTEGDELGGTYVYRGSEPTTPGKFQDVNGHWFGAKVVGTPLPSDFGAVGDGVADDGEAINTWAQYLRDNNLRGYWPAGEYFCGTTTLYLGGVQIDCAGSKVNERWLGVGTVVKSNANPIATNTTAGTAGLYTNTVITGLSIAGAGGTVPTIDLWDYVGYPYQVGWMLGRGPGYVDGGAAVDGYGVFHLVGGTIQDIGGWGSYQYEGTGDSTVERFQYRCCGGKAAVELGLVLGDTDAGNQLGGAILVQANSVDTKYIGCHAINSKNEDGTLGNAAYNSTATCVRLGATKTVTDMLSRDYAHAINNVHFENLHSEGYAIGADVRGTKWTVFSELNVNGHGGTLGAIRVGVATNPGSSDLRVQFDNLRVAGSVGIDVVHGENVDLGVAVNGTPSSVTPVSYYRELKGEFLGSGYDQAELAAKGWSLHPKPDPVADFGIGSDTTWGPMMRTAAIPTTLMGNMFPSFNDGAGGTVLAGWVYESQADGVVVVDESGSAVSVAEEATVMYEVAGATAGNVYTLQFWADWVGEVNLGDLLWKVQDGSDADVYARAMGVGLEADGSYYHCIQFLAPSDGVIRFRFRLGGTSAPAFLRAPMLHLGTAPPVGRALPTQWAASNGVFSTG